MTREERAARIAAILDAKFPAVDSALDHESPFQLLVATILSAQCSDARVNIVTPALFARAPDAPTMAKMRAREILPFIKSCGLAPGKAKRLAAMSRALVKNHGGQVPREMDALEELPGVGHKTAGVVLAQAFGDAQFPVDTHIHRLAGRWGLSRARDVDEVERDLKALFPRRAGARAISRSSTSVAANARRADTIRRPVRSAAGRCRKRGSPTPSPARA